MPQIMRNLIEEYVNAIRNIYGVHLKQVILYGSYARGDFGKDSDVDIMLLVDLPEEKIQNVSITLIFLWKLSRSVEQVEWMAFTSVELSVASMLPIHMRMQI